MTSRLSSADRTAASPWVSAHIFYQGSLNTVVTDLVGPLTQQLSNDGSISDWFYLRYWDGGPHVRLRLLPAHGVAAGRIRRSVLSAATTFFEVNPSRTQLSQRDYRSYAHRLAAREGAQSFSDTLFPNQSVQFIAYAREHDRYGTGRAIAAVEQHFGRASRMATAIVTAAPSDRQLNAVALVAILQSWLAATRDLSTLHTWSVNHPWDSFRPIAAGYDALLHERYTGQRGRLIEVVRDVIAAPGSTLSRWWDTVTELVADVAVIEADAPQELPISATTSCAGLPILDICAHLFCNRIGVAPHEEHYLRHLIRRLLGELVGARS
ncbi:lantibiotic dehydratase C-terminal domain-containing protein [Nocardia sp. CY41]|uniref:lantibiotic dehydratase C-terminal domain-containing protein n=1 Tax=Nocardia sp. CY41 TaxID=2608686 RepID=UPI001359DFD9|nr:lantibiotic dehydratase C-terminal domain-containing protein [Nocardia sp. CY41]